MTGRPEAAEAIWRISEEAGAAQQVGSRRGRTRGSLQALVGLCVGLGLALFGWPTLGRVVMGVALLIGISALLSPGVLYAGIERFFDASGRVLGRAVTWLLMLPLFYLFFLPFGRLLRRGRRDRLQRFYDEQAASYWEPRQGPTAASDSRERQY